MAMNPCRECGNKDRKYWKFVFNDATRQVAAICRECGHIVQFKAKHRKPYDPNKIEACAEYEIRDGKRFLKIDGEFKEVYLKKLKHGALRVMPT